MRADTTGLLVCPDTGATDFSLFGARVLRGKAALEAVPAAGLLPGDEILDGVLLGGDRAYPVRHGVLSLLSDASADPRAWQEHFQAVRPLCPGPVQATVDRTLDRVDRAAATADGRWNRDEMRYYDEAVATPEKREAMRQAILGRYLGRTFHTRERVILAALRPQARGKRVLEVGCGTARTVARLLRPEEWGFDYVGVDISFQRLAVARSLLPAGLFVQASALELPFRDGIADVGLAFGALHHLPRPLEALECLDRVLRDECLLGLHEPLATPKLVEGRWPRLQRLLTTYEHSVHDGEVERGEVDRFLAGHGFAVLRRDESVSPFRTLVETLLRLASSEAVIESPTLARVLHPLDAVFLGTVGRLSRTLGPRSLTLLAGRRGRKPRPA